VKLWPRKCGEISGVGVGGAEGASELPTVLIFQKFGKISKNLGKEVSTFLNNINEIKLACY